MYYFIFEQPENNQASRLHDHIRLTLDDLGIIQEAVKANPVQSPEDLTKEGLQKKFTTIVVVGRDKTINKVAGIVAQSDKCALGIVPTNPKSTFRELLGVNNWKEACEILPARKLLTSDMAEIQDNYYFLTHIQIQPGFTKEGYSPKLANFLINFGTYNVEIKTREIIVANALLNFANEQVIRSSMEDKKIDVVIQPESMNSGGFLDFLTAKNSGFNRKKLSVFHTEDVEIRSDSPIAIVANNEIIAKTPARFRIANFDLKIITKKQT